MFRSYAKHFWIFPRERNCRILIGSWKYVFMNHPIMFLERHNKTKSVPASFSYFLELLWPLWSLCVIAKLIKLFYWCLRSKCLWFCRAENFSFRFFQIFRLKFFGTTSGILQEEADLLQTQLLPFPWKFIDSWHWLHTPNTLRRSLDQGQC